MCHRVSPLVIAELKAALEGLRSTGHARVPQRDPNTVVPDAYPGKQLPLFTVDDSGQLQASELIWGFDGPPSSSSRFVFNTRIETALSQARSGRGLWAKPINSGRCLVPVRSFWESWTINSPRRGAQVRFALPGHQVFLLAGIHDNGRVSIVTTPPNADVLPMHSRMPLVLGPSESTIWLGPDYASLADRSHIKLDVFPEEDAQREKPAALF